MADGGPYELNHGNVNLHGWRNGRLSDTQRYIMLSVILEQRNQIQLSELLTIRWDVNERFPVLPNQEGDTALIMAIHERWTEGVRMLLDAGADPNDHDGEYKKIPLFLAIKNCDGAIVDLLLKYGANPYVKSETPDWMPLEFFGTTEWTMLHEAVVSKDMELVREFSEYFEPDILTGVLAVALREMNWDELDELVQLLLNHGANVNYIAPDGQPLLHSLCLYEPDGETIFPRTFPHKSLDLFFQNGCDINVEHSWQDPDHSTHHETVVESIVKHDILRAGTVKANFKVGWLIRHGADVAHIRFTLLKEYFIPNGESFGKPSQIPRILLEVGMRVPFEVQTVLSNMEGAIQTWLQEDDEDDEALQTELNDMWVALMMDEEEGRQRMPITSMKTTFSEYHASQMADLEKFSGGSVDVYPKDQSDLELYIGKYQCALTHIRGVLEYFRQPRPLQWFCRRRVRESLQSLQPSVVNTLTLSPSEPLPDTVKCQILCFAKIPIDDEGGVGHPGLTKNDRKRKKKNAENHMTTFTKKIP